MTLDKSALRKLPKKGENGEAQYKLSLTNKTNLTFGLVESMVRDLNKRPDIIALDLSGHDLGEDEIASLAGLKHIKKLDLSTVDVLDPVTDGIGISARALEVLAQGLPELTELSLAGNEVTAEGIQHLSKLSKLHTLDLSDMGFFMSDTTSTDFDEVLPALLKLPHLTSLDISDSDISDDHLPKIAALKNLTHLSVQDTDLTQQGVTDLARALLNLKSLVPPATDLMVGSVPYSGESLQRLREQPVMDYLPYASETSLAGVTEVPGTNGYTQIDVGAKNSVPIEPAAFQKIDGQEITANTIKDLLVEHPHVRQLNLTGCTSPDFNAVIEALQESRSLKHLVIEETDQITDEHVGALSALKELRSLHLGHTAVTEGGARKLVQQLPKLDELVAGEMVDLMLGKHSIQIPGQGRYMQLDALNGKVTTDILDIAASTKRIAGVSEIPENVLTGNTQITVGVPYSGTIKAHGTW